ncbi:hypothetical protein P7K49_021026 [Saguinus oedipus]|uniref:40S ribosomal protein S25 n=1 Tax=Saguinus oedipus TaxID=9490 RepID=A0ABQ9URG5_SAGOE|nr:hypothetical protein P7K49_021026 [Saguinus oedipus]
MHFNHGFSKVRFTDDLLQHKQETAEKEILLTMFILCSSLLSELRNATQGRQEEERRWKVGQDKDPVNKSGGKAKKKKWSKGKVRDKLNNLVLFDKATYDKLCKEVPNYKLITPAVVSERLKIRGSLAKPFRSSLAKDLSNWFQSTELK